MSENQNKSIIFFYILFFLSVGLNIFFFFQYVRKSKQITQQNTALALMLDESNITKDSLQRELNFLVTQLEDKINENLALQDLKEDIRTKLEQKIIELQRTKNQISQLINDAGLTSPDGKPLTLAQASVELKKLRDDNKQYIAKLASVSSEKEKLAENLEQKEQELAAVKEKEQGLNMVKQVLTEKLEKSSIVRVTNIEISPLIEKKSKSVETKKASKIDKLKISFDVIGQENIEKAQKKLDIRVLGTNNQVLSASNNRLMDSDKLISTSQMIDYDGTDKKIVIYFKSKEEKYQKGLHKIEILENGVLLGKKTLNLE